MTRTELLENLSQVEFCAVPTYMTMDMGIEYDYIFPTGAGTCLGGIGVWPAYRLRKIDDQKWMLIKQKLQEHTLTEEDFKGTDIGLLIEMLRSNYGNLEDMYNNFYHDVSETFANIANLPDTLPDIFYCMLDIGEWGEFPEFYISEDEFIKDFQDKYCSDARSWENYTDEELETWLERTEDDLAEFSFNYFGDDEDSED